MPDAHVFNGWHADVARSSACDLIFQQALRLPSGLVSNSLLTGDAIAEVAAALRLAPGQTLVDLACGRGGYSREMARRTGARLVGLDFSAVAVTMAWEPTETADQRLPERTRRMNLARDLGQAGFEQVAVTGKPDWYAAERALWEAALRADADGDPGLVALQEEATERLATFDSKRRVFAIATAPTA